jgi:hypothetical protein
MCSAVIWPPSTIPSQNVAPMRLMNSSALWIIALWACMSVLLAILGWPPSIPHLLDIVRNEATAMGTVTSTDCGNHASVNYSFDINGRSFEGAESMGDLCRRIVAGSPITIHYFTKSPKHNIASDPVAKFWNDAIAFLLACLSFPPLAVLLLRRRWRRKPHDVRRS